MIGGVWVVIDVLRTCDVIVSSWSPSWLAVAMCHGGPIRSMGPMMMSWDSTSRTLYHTVWTWSYPLESRKDTVRGISRMTERELESPSRSTRSTGLLRAVVVGGNWLYSLREIKLLPCAPVWRRPDVKCIGWTRLGRMIDPGLTNGWQSNEECSDVEDDRWSSRALQSCRSGSNTSVDFDWTLISAAGWSFVRVEMKGPAVSYLFSNRLGVGVECGRGVIGTYGRLVGVSG